MIASERRLIAILRGIQPQDSVEVGKVLIEAGITWIEVPLNSPEPYKSIENLSRTLQGKAKIGAGTVLRPAEVSRVKEAGGTFIVSPNADADVIRTTKSAGMGSCPGVFTATEAFLAINAGADILKLFPASLLGLSGIKAIKAVLPPEPPIYAVGGVDAENFDEYREAGVAGFGLGSSLYKPGADAKQLHAAACGICSAYDRIFKQG